MKFKLLQLKEDIQTNYWIFPVLLTLTSVFLLTITLSIDHSLASYFLLDEYRLFHIDRDGIRQILSTITTTSITITSVTLSIAILILSLASNQLGPRLLPNFIRQRQTQFAIGMFVSVYIYCLLLMVVSSNDYFNNKPIFISLYVGILLAIASFFVLIVFIQSVSSSIQVDNVLVDLSGQIRDSMTESLDRDEASPSAAVIDEFEQQKPSHTICARKYGYIQTIEFNDLKCLATDSDVMIELLVKPGQYLLDSTIIANVYHKVDDLSVLETAINQLISTGSKRTIIQDIEYGFEQIVEIAVRALSPGINNPFTAINCIHMLGALLNELHTKSLPSGYMMDEDKALRLVYPEHTYEGFVNTSFNQIRQNAKQSLGVMIELLTVIGQLLKLPLPEAMSAALVNQAVCLIEQAKEQNLHQRDLNDLMEAASF